MNYILPNPAISSTPIEKLEVVNGKHSFKRLTTQSNNFMYIALAKASLAFAACSGFKGTLYVQYRGVYKVGVVQRRRVYLITVPMVPFLVVVITR